jgi:DMSO reductase family type II enzyme heme b subunit
MKARRTRAATSELLDPKSTIWNVASEESIELFPTPVGMAAAQSPYMAMSADHGKIRSLQTSALHNGETLALRLTWRSPEPNEIDDLDRFSDAVGVMFPISEVAEPLTMGSAGNPVNAWYYRAGESEPFDVIAEGFGTHLRRRRCDGSRLEARAVYDFGRWTVTFQRPLLVGEDYAAFSAGTVTRIAFAAWEGSNGERAGRKSASLRFVDLELEA